MPKKADGEISGNIEEADIPQESPEAQRELSAQEELDRRRAEEEDLVERSNIARAARKQEKEKRDFEAVMRRDAEKRKELDDDIGKKPQPQNAFTLFLKRIVRIFIPTAFPEVENYLGSLRAYEKRAAERDLRHEREARAAERTAEREKKLENRQNAAEASRGEAERLIRKLEADRGDVSLQTKQNIRALSLNAALGAYDINEKCDEGLLFRGGDEVKDIVSFNRLRNEINAGTLSDRDLLLLGAKDCVKTCRELTALSSHMTYIAEHSHTPEFYREQVLGKNGLKSLTDKYTSALNDIDKNRPDLGQQRMKAQQRAAAEWEKKYLKNKSPAAKEEIHSEKAEKQPKKTEISENKEEIKAENLKQPEAPAEIKKQDDAELLIYRLEQTNGKLPEQVKENIRFIQNRANEAEKNIREKIEKGQAFKAGEDARYIVMNHSLKKDLGGEKLSPEILELLGSDRYVNAAMKFTTLSVRVNYLSEHAHMPEYYQKQLFDPAKLDAIEKSYINTLKKVNDKNLDIDEQQKLAMEKAEARWREKHPEAVELKNGIVPEAPENALQSVNPASLPPQTQPAAVG